MTYSNRKKLYEMISQERNRPLVVYVTSIRPNLSAQMAGDSITSIIEQIELIPNEQKEIDFLIISNGGDPITALRIMSLLRERFDKIGVLLPYVAYSAATILSLGADEVIMHPYSNLGPVDPQLTVSHNNANGVQEQLDFSSEDLRNYIDFIRTDVGITDQQYLTAAIQPLIKDVGSLPIGTAKRSQQLSLALSEKMLGWHFTDSEKAKTIAKALNSSYYHHGYAVGRKEAKEIGLPISDPSKSIEQNMWAIWKDFESEMHCNNAFNIINEIMNDPMIYSMVNQAPVVDFPLNFPKELTQQIMAQIAQNISLTTRTSIRKQYLLASIESVNSAKAIYNNIDIMYWREVDMSLSWNYVTSDTGWVDYIREGTAKNDNQENNAGIV